MNRILVSLLLSAIIACDLDLASAQEVDTSNGRVRGRTTVVDGKSLEIFQGIPFAEPPIGDLRFKYPRQVRPWRPEVKNATSFQPSCVQSMMVYETTASEKAFRLPGNMSEDCLYLNIWKPASANSSSPLAVMVWIYGGGFNTGSTATPLYNGQHLAAQNDVIVVSINYRVGVFGFGYLSSETIPGNMGFLDQVEALKWIQLNIEYFGGDKNRVTIFGESAGSLSVGYHLLSPLSKDLFTRGILESGSPIQSTEGSFTWPKSFVKDAVRKLGTALGCSGTSDDSVLNCLKSADPDSIINAVDSGNLAFLVILDGTFLQKDPLAVLEAGEQKKADILMGTNRDEVGLFFYQFMFPNKTMKSTGDVFSAKDVDLAIRMTSMLTDDAKVQAARIFYESQQEPPLDYLQYVIDLGTDVYFRCAARKFSLFYSNDSDVYMYSLNHMMASTIQPAWMGVPHAYELPLVFGVPLNEEGFTADELALSKIMGTYWSNFAKSGNPNTPVSVSTNWPAFNAYNETYMALDVGGGLKSSNWLRRHDCSFVNDILPMIQSEKTAVTTAPGNTDYSNESSAITGIVLVVTCTLASILWQRR